MTKQYRHIFIVEGGVPFPLDMLRYDSCHPADGEAVAHIEWSIEHIKGRRRVKLAHVGPSQWRPTQGRWESFHWQVVPDSLQKGEL